MRPDSFYVLEPRWTSGDRVYRIYVTDTAFCGARVAGQFFDMNFYAPQLLAAADIFAFLLAPFMKKKVEKAERSRDELIAFYDSVAPGSAEFLGAHEHNFCIPKQDVERILISRKKSRWMAGYPHTGSLVFKLRGGKSKRFIVLGDQDVLHIQFYLKRLVTNSEFVA